MNVTFQAEGSVKFNQDFAWFRYFTSNDPFGPGTPINDNYEIVLTPGTNYYIWVRQASINGATRGTSLYRASNASNGGADGHVILSNTVTNTQPLTWEWIRYTNLNGNPYFTKRDGTGGLDDNSKFDWAVVVKTDNGVGEVYVDKILVTTDANYVPNYQTANIPGISTCNNAPEECALDSYDISYCSGQKSIIDSRNERLFVNFDSNFNDVLGNNPGLQIVGVQTSNDAIIGKSGVFNGSSYLKFNNTNYTNFYFFGFGISFWMKANASQNGAIISKFNYSNLDEGKYELSKFSGPNLNFVLGKDAGAQSYNYLILNDGAWHHYVITFGGINLSFYEDGVIKNSVNTDPGLAMSSIVSSSPFYIGQTDRLDNAFTGMLDEIEIGRYLFANEVQTKYMQKFSNYAISEEINWQCVSVSSLSLNVCGSPSAPLIIMENCTVSGKTCSSGTCISPTLPGDSSSPGSSSSSSSSSSSDGIVYRRTNVSNLCGNGVCNAVENENTCPLDCKRQQIEQEDIILESICGDGVCGLDENKQLCSEDCSSKDSVFMLILIIVFVLLFIGIILLIVRAVYLNKKTDLGSSNIYTSKSLNEVSKY